uniref:Ionotropic glutamate receptor L-glutamate and glycine-binding domain-containing protein n=1 Tax=Panagrolaimus sp. ES5 TaxID=591445 RepID=A0AC34G4X4_9BILA
MNGIQSKVAIWSDTVAVLKKALLKAQVLKQSITEPQNDPICQRIPLAIRDFRTTLISTKIINGLTGNISFELDGRRKNFEMFVFQSDQKREWNKVNRWNSKERKLLPIKEEKTQNNTRDNRLHLKVTVYLEEPFVSKKPNTSDIDKNDQYEGYCIDLLEKIAELRNFTYEIYEVPDKTYGVKEANGRWTGMVQTINNK